MAVQVTVSVLFPTLSKQDVIDLVVANDSAEDDTPIAADAVRAHHVLALWSTPEWPHSEKVVDYITLDSIHEFPGERYKLVQMDDDGVE